jgi:hypothetical protein
MNRKLMALMIGVLVMLAAPMFAEAAGKSKKMHYRYSLNKQAGCPVRQIADGSLVDCHGWRKWSGSIGWDNTCFNLDYLPSEFACSSKRR